MENPVNYAYPEYVREELIDGVWVAMAPGPNTGHLRISGNIYSIFRSYLRGKKCEVFPDGLDVYLTENDIFEPDCTVVCDPEKVKRKGIYGAPDLVVEVLSPSTSKMDRGYKRQVYEQCGVKEYWIVSPVGRSVETYLLAEGRLEFSNVYHLYDEEELDDLTPAERDAIPKSFKCSLFDDLDISLDDVFERVE